MFTAVSVKALTDRFVQRLVFRFTACCVTFKLVLFFTVKLTQIRNVMTRHVTLPCDDEDEDESEFDVVEDDADDADRGVHEADK